MNQEGAEVIENVPVNQIRIANPRTRNKVTWREIVSSIRAVGLKKPITVSRRKEPDADGNQYDLVCGQGRLEAFREIGLDTIPAIITEASEPDQYLMSLIENIARRPSSNQSLYFEVKNLLRRGYDHGVIAKKLGIDRAYTRGIVRLVEKDEPRLIAAVESGTLPVTVAIQIATGEDEGIQTALMQAYESGELRGAKLRTVRELIKARKTQQDGRQRPQRALTRCQSRRRRQHVIPDPHPSSCGSIYQGIPLRRTKAMPVRHARSETRDRPPCGRRARIGKKGSTRFHNRSGSNAAPICRSRYFANEDQVRWVLLRALRADERLLSIYGETCRVVLGVFGHVHGSVGGAKEAVFGGSILWVNGKSPAG